MSTHYCQIDCQKILVAGTWRHIMFPPDPTPANLDMKRWEYRVTGQGPTREVRVWEYIRYQMLWSARSDFGMTRNDATSLPREEAILMHEKRVAARNRKVNRFKKSEKLAGNPAIL